MAEFGIKVVGWAPADSSAEASDRYVSAQFIGVAANMVFANLGDIPGPEVVPVPRPERWRTESANKATLHGAGPRTEVGRGIKARRDPGEKRTYLPESVYQKEPRRYDILSMGHAFRMPRRRTDVCGTI